MKLLKIAFWALGSLAIIANLAFIENRISRKSVELSRLNDVLNTDILDGEQMRYRLGQFERGDFAAKTTHHFSILYPDSIKLQEQLELDMANSIPFLLPSEVKPEPYRDRWRMMKFHELRMVKNYWKDDFMNRWDEIVLQVHVDRGRITGKSAEINRLNRLSFFLQIMGLALIFSADFWGRLADKK